MNSDTAVFNEQLCNNTIPAEIITKIVAQMFAGERFTAYILIPAWPEGDPSSAVTQAMLHWHHQTVPMMY